MKNKAQAIPKPLTAAQFDTDIPREFTLADGTNVTARLRRAYQSVRVVGVNFHHRRGTAVVRIEKYDINPKLQQFDRQLAEEAIVALYTRVACEDSLARAREQFVEHEKSGLFSGCVISRA